MTVKVVEEHIFKCECPTCKAKLEASTADIYRWEHTDYTGDTDHYSGCRCPKCGADVKIKGFETSGNFPMWWRHPSYDGDGIAEAKRRQENAA